MVVASTVNGVVCVALPNDVPTTEDVVERGKGLAGPSDADTTVVGEVGEVRTVVIVVVEVEVSVLSTVLCTGCAVESPSVSKSVRGNVTELVWTRLLVSACPVGLVVGSKSTVPVEPLAILAAVLDFMSVSPVVEESEVGSAGLTVAEELLTSSVLTILMSSFLHVGMWVISFGVYVLACVVTTVLDVSVMFGSNTTSAVLHTISAVKDVSVDATFGVLGLGVEEAAADSAFLVVSKYSVGGLGCTTEAPKDDVREVVGFVDKPPAVPEPGLTSVAVNEVTGGTGVS